MRRIYCFLVLSLLLSAGAPALAAGPFQYESEELGFSMTVPSLPVADIVVEESETGVAFFHRPSQASWGGLLGTIQVVSPRQSLLGAVVSAQLRFATPDTVELTVWYHPYESIYATDLVAAWQTSIGVEDLL